MKIAIIINITFFAYSCVLYIKALKNATTIEYNIRKDFLLQALYNDDRLLFRTATIVKLWLLLSLSILQLLWSGSKLVSPCPFSSTFAMVLSIMISIGWFLVALLMYLLYSKKDFTIFTVTKKPPSS